MLFGNEIEYMYFDGRTYMNGTHFTVKDEYIATHKPNGKKIWKHARFWGTLNGPDGLYYYFARAKYSFCDLYEVSKQTEESIASLQADYAPFFTARPWELHDVIEEFTKPLMISEEEEAARQEAITRTIEHPNNDWDYPEMRFGWIVYILVLIGSLIFKQFYIPWAIATYIFYIYRKGVIG